MQLNQLTPSSQDTQLVVQQMKEETFSIHKGRKKNDPVLKKNKVNQNSMLLSFSYHSCKHELDVHKFI